MSSESTIEKEILNVTDEAAVKIAELIAEEEEENLALRVGVKPGGCSGYKYEMYFDSDREQSDMEILVKDGVKVVVDDQSATILNGSTLGYKNSLQGAGFYLDNPNANRSCGCGNSFS